VKAARLEELSQRVRDLGLSVRVLARISWSEQVIDGFVASWRRRNPVLPSVDQRPDPELAHIASQLDDVVAEIGRTDDPVLSFLVRTASSYGDAARLVNSAGTYEFHRWTTQLYGDPSKTLPGATITSREAAERVLAITAPLRAASVHEDDLLCLLPTVVAAQMQSRVDTFFGPGAVTVVVDPSLGAKAAASVNRIRIRGGTSFSESDIEQLLEHEAFIHSATAKNGERQPVLKALRLGAPRTTATQEGLATLAELMTGTMDLSRLRRLALRIVAVDLAMQGADFIEVFRYFLEQGQTEDESARSAARVFRGGDVRGGIAFTKDTVYLHGLVSVHTFLRRAIADGRLELIPRLFAGRLALSDVLELGPAFEDGTVVPGRFVPAWARDARRLAASLSFSVVINAIDLGAVELHNFDL